VLDQVIQLKDGEPSILAGIVTKQDNKSVSGTPYIGELPFFKFFFASQDKEVQQDEIVFLLIPHIVRESVLTNVNRAVIDTGPLNSIELRRDEAPKPLAGADLGDPGLNRPVSGPETTAANAAEAARQQLRAQAAPPAGSGALPVTTATVPANAPSTSAFAQPVSVAVVPANANQAVGGTFQVAVMLSGGQNIAAVPMDIAFDSRILRLVNVDAGDFLQKDGQPATIAHVQKADGVVTINTARAPGAKGVNGQGTVCTLTFTAVAPGNATVSFARVGAKDSSQNAIPANGTQAVIHVK
jgi:general secretion pathway protein D